MLHILLVTTRYGPRHFTTFTWNIVCQANKKKTKEHVYADISVCEALGQTYARLAVMWDQNSQAASP